MPGRSEGVVEGGGEEHILIKICKGFIVAGKNLAFIEIVHCSKCKDECARYVIATGIFMKGRFD